MTVFNGLGSFFLKSCFNFEVTFLKSTTVVINGDDFTHFILKNIIGSEDDKHNEPLLFSVTASKLMSQLEMCEINPIFIFDSHTEPEYRWYSGGQTWYSIKRYKSSFMDVLSDFGMQYSTSFYSAEYDAAVLSIYLNCPLIASSYDFYYMFPAEAPKTETSILQELAYIPVDLLDVFSYQNECLILSHIFHQKSSNLPSVKPHLRPLLSLLYSGSAEVRANFCKQLYCDEINRLNIVNPVFCEWYVLVCWLVFLPNMYSATPYERVIVARSIEERPAIIDYLLHCITAFMDDIEGYGRMIASFFSLPKSNSQIAAGILVEIDENATNAPSKLGQIDRLDKEFITKLPITFDFAVNWQVSVIELYRNVKSFRPIIDILYQLNDSMKNTFPSDHIYAICLKSIIYRILHGLECCAGIKVKPDVPEDSWRDNSMPNKISLNINPLFIGSYENTLVDKMMCDQLNVNLTPCTLTPDWVFGLAITLALWHQQHIIGDPAYVDDFESSSIGLAVAACAVANVFNVDFMNNNLLEHYERLINFIRKEVSDITRRAILGNQSNNSALSNATKTENNSSNLISVERLYIELQTIGSLLNRLMEKYEDKSKLFHFLPSGILFPSGRLIDCLSCYLDSQLPSVRLLHVSSYWLPRLFSSRTSSTVLTNLTDTFKCLVNIVTLVCQSSMLQLKPSYVMEKCDLDTSVSNALGATPFRGGSHTEVTCQENKQIPVKSNMESHNMHLCRHLTTQSSNRLPFRDLTGQQNIT